MSKTFKTTNTTYHVTAKYLNRATFALDDIEFDIDTKNKRLIGKYVLEHYENCKNATDIMITDIKAITTTTNVTINASLNDIIAACKAAGITVTYNDSDNEDTNNPDDITTEDNDN